MAKASMIETQPKAMARLTGAPGWMRLTQAQLKLRLTLPYGVWTCADGRQVMYNRNYQPIWQRYPSQPPEPADPSEWVDYTAEDVGSFYDDSCSPWYPWGRALAAKREARRALARCQTMLAEWGCPPITDEHLQRINTAPKPEPQRYRA